MAGFLTTEGTEFTELRLMGFETWVVCIGCVANYSTLTTDCSL